MVRRVRIVLRLEAQRVVLRMLLTRLAVLRSIQEVAGVELHARLRRSHREYASTARIVDPSCGLDLAVLAAQHPVVVVAPGDLQLLVILSDACANRSRMPEVERCALDGPQ